MSLTNDVNIELLKISQWIKANKRSLNISKTKRMVFQNTQSQLHNQVIIVLPSDRIENVEHFKCLGIWIDKNLHRKKTNEKCKNITQILAISNKI